MHEPRWGEWAHFFFFDLSHASFYYFLIKIHLNTHTLWVCSSSTVSAALSHPLADLTSPQVSEDSFDTLSLLLLFTNLLFELPAHPSSLMALIIDNTMLQSLSLSVCSPPYSPVCMTPCLLSVLSLVRSVGFYFWWILNTVQDFHTAEADFQLSVSEYAVFKIWVVGEHFGSRPKMWLKVWLAGWFNSGRMNFGKKHLNKMYKNKE